MKRQLFVIPPDTWSSLDEDEVFATAAAMKELGIYKLPYPAIDIALPANRTFGWDYDHLVEQGQYAEADLQEDIKNGIYEITESGQYRPTIGSGIVFEFHNMSLDHTDYKIHVRIEPGSPATKFYKGKSISKGTTNLEHLIQSTRDKISSALIVLLATRNAVKETKRDKLAALGIGKASRRHEYVTTITLPKVLEEDGNEPKTEGKPKAPHLRRGHIRQQKYGPKFSLSRPIWIEPVFVNADKDWVDTRKRYNISL